MIAQNGVQVSAGAAATVRRNVISGNVYTPAGTESTGVLVAGAGAVTVSDNDLLGNEVGVYITGQQVPVLVGGNRILGSALDGVVVEDSSGVTLFNNRVAGSGRDGVRLDGATGTLVALNRVTGSGEVGLRVTGASSGNLILLNRLVGQRRLRRARRHGRPRHRGHGRLLAVQRDRRVGHAGAGVRRGRSGGDPRVSPGAFFLRPEAGRRPETAGAWVSVFSPASGRKKMPRVKPGFTRKRPPLK